MTDHHIVTDDKRNSLMWLNLGLSNPPSNLILGNPPKIGLGNPLTEFRVGVRFRLTVKAGVGVSVGVGVSSKQSFILARVR